VVDVEASFETGEFQCLLIQSLLQIIALRVMLESSENRVSWCNHNNKQLAVDSLSPE
jgi:hypothetical protein